MNELEEYMSHYWEGYDGESDLIGLTPGGFNSEKELSISNFDKAQLDWALDFAHACGEPTQRINKNHSSYGLKHLAERRAAKLSDGEVRYISNGALILAMVDAGFEFRKIEDTPNVYFNVSERALTQLFKLYNNR